MTKKQILDFAKKNLHSAVYIEWADAEYWHYFRIERVKSREIAITGMIDNEGVRHDGNFFWVNCSEIEEIQLRD